MRRGELLKALARQREQLGRARSEIRVMRRYADHPLLELRSDGDPPRFVQLVVQQRGPFGVLHALDAAGQVWENHRTTQTDQNTKIVSVIDEWWEPVGMARRHRPPVAPPAEAKG